ncbi:hypothetical protein HLB23_10365 [Nocardia uniformis]|uniref:Uncharacterized protein n=1 Tax=Nocardia uniformis TaxID=53432 RepID=A0A849CBC1_9NOCA|nr:hypothetical protein [Nocardia uniformis]NNH70261.1 hypothetical protein [Nocardia uniformis]
MRRSLRRHVRSATAAGALLLASLAGCGSEADPATSSDDVLLTTCAEFMQLTRSDQSTFVGKVVVAKDPSAKRTGDTGQPSMALRAATIEVQRDCAKPDLADRTVANTLQGTVR